MWKYIKNMDAADWLIMLFEGVAFLAFLAGACALLLIVAAAMNAL